MVNLYIKIKLIKKMVN